MTPVLESSGTLVVDHNPSQSSVSLSRSCWPPYFSISGEISSRPDALLPFRPALTVLKHYKLETGENETKYINSFFFFYLTIIDNKGDYGVDFLCDRFLHQIVVSDFLQKRGGGTVEIHIFSNPLIAHLRGYTSI